MCDTKGRRSGTEKTRSSGVEAEAYHSNNTFRLSEHPDEERRNAAMARRAAKQARAVRAKRDIRTRAADITQDVLEALLRLRAYVFGDLHEEYEGIKARKGERRAQLWLSSQIARSLRPLLWMAIKIVLRILLRILLPAEFHRFIP